ncbi:hypothetical protein GGI12_005257, partial [Dipsacomyces acuminosporus]
MPRVRQRRRSSRSAQRNMSMSGEGYVLRRRREAELLHIDVSEHLGYDGGLIGIIRRNAAREAIANTELDASASVSTNMVTESRGDRSDSDVETTVSNRQADMGTESSISHQGDSDSDSIPCILDNVMESSHSANVSDSDDDGIYSNA